MANEKHVGRCNMCEKTWDDATEWEELRECPNCKTDEYLMDLNPEKWEGKKAKHTPGPWRRETYSDRIAIQKPSGVNIAQVIREEDSRLIAAAPELLAALEKMVNLNDGINDGGEGITAADWDTARAAIAKAKSE